MKFKPGFKLYLLWRVVRGVVLTLTMPLWVPLALLGMCMYYTWETIHEWYEDVCRDWRMK